MKETKYTEMNQEQKTAVGDYLQSRLGQYSIHSYDFDWEVGKESDIATQKVSIKECGILKYMLKEVEIYIRFHQNEDGIHVGRLNFSYTHHNGGSNGHDTEIVLYSHNDGRVYEVQK